MEFHCGYRPARSECWLSTMSGVRPEPDETYEIGYDPYWGIDYIRHPRRLSGLDDRGTPQEVTMWRIYLLRYHRVDAFVFVTALLVYAWLVHAAYRKSLARPAIPLPRFTAALTKKERPMATFQPNVYQKVMQDFLAGTSAATDLRSAVITYQSGNSLQDKIDSSYNVLKVLKAIIDVAHEIAVLRNLAVFTDLLMAGNKVSADMETLGYSARQ